MAQKNNRVQILGVSPTLLLQIITILATIIQVAWILDLKIIIRFLMGTLKLIVITMVNQVIMTMTLVTPLQEYLLEIVGARV